MNMLAKLACAAAPAALICAPAMAQQANDTVLVLGVRTTPMEEAPTLGKTGTALEDLPRSIQVIPHELIDQQGGVLLKDAIRNVSGIAEGGNFGFGFYDRFAVRGLPVSFVTDGLPDTTSDVGGYVHSLTGVERVEVLKGPGSALLGAALAGSSINLVHYTPNGTLSGSVSEQYGSYNSTTSKVSLNIPLSSTVAARIDGEYFNTDGFRGLRNQTAEILGAIAFRPKNHEIIVRGEYHELEATPDAVGIPFTPPGNTGRPAEVDVRNRYYTPFAFANQSIKRISFSDAWRINDALTVNIRSAYSERDVDLARNVGGTLTLNADRATYSLRARQLRAQSDSIHDFMFQVEPTWHGTIGAMPVTLLVGAEARKIDAMSVRNSANLPNIENISNPVTPETSIAALTFLCDSGHSCNDADIDGRFYGVYGVAQIDLTDRLKVRGSVRQNWFRSSLEGRSVIPLNPGSQRACTPPRATACPLVPGDPLIRRDEPISWDAGAVYHLFDGLSFFGGYSTSANPLFNTEETQAIGQMPDKGTQVEGGVRITPGKWLTLTSTLYRTTRSNVFVILSVPDPAGTGSLSTAQSYALRVRGWETDVNLHPVAGWTITGNFALQDPRITDYPQAPANVGNQVQSVPKRIANIWTAYDIALPGTVGTLQLSAGARYRSSYFGDPAEIRVLPGSTLVDSSVAWTRGRWTVRAGMQNIFDEQSWTSAGVGAGAIPGPGRTFFVSGAVKTF